MPPAAIGEAVFAAILDVLFPECCPACGAASLSGRVCAPCCEEIPALLRAITPPPALTSAWILGTYDGPLGGWIRQGKYQSDPRAFAFIGARLAAAAAGRLPRVDAVTFVPTAPRRRIRRGFDQAALLAAPVAAALGVPLVSALRRTRSTEQSTRSSRERRIGARGAFAIGRAHLPLRVLLVDDVVTSGATARACAEELLCGGVRRVHLLCAVGAGA